MAPPTLPPLPADPEVKRAPTHPGHLWQASLTPELGREAIPLQNVPAESGSSLFSLYVYVPDCSLLFSLLPCLLSPSSVQQASYAASSFSSVSYCVQQTKVAFTPEDGSATQGISVSVSNSFLSRHGNLPVPSVSRSLLLATGKLVSEIFPLSLLPPDVCAAAHRRLCLSAGPCTRWERVCVVGWLWPKGLCEPVGRGSLAATLGTSSPRHKLAGMSWPFYSILTLGLGSAL